MKKYQMYIDGKFVDAAGGRWFDSYYPYTGKVWAQVAQGEAQDADRAVEAAHRALSGPWSQLTASQRGLLIHRLGDLVARDAWQLAEMEVQDNGKLIAEMGGQTGRLNSLGCLFDRIFHPVEADPETSGVEFRPGGPGIPVPGLADAARVEQPLAAGHGQLGSLGGQYRGDP